MQILGNISSPADQVLQVVSWAQRHQVDASPAWSRDDSRSTLGLVKNGAVSREFL